MPQVLRAKLQKESWFTGPCTMLEISYVSIYCVSLIMFVINILFEYLLYLCNQRGGLREVCLLPDNDHGVRCSSWQTPSIPSPSDTNHSLPVLSAPIFPLSLSGQILRFSIICLRPSALYESSSS